MIRKLIPLAVLIVLVIGCKKKPVDTGDGGAGDGKPDGDPQATYTLKLRNEQSGDKIEVTESETGEFSTGDKGEKEKQDKKVQYTETIIEMPAGDKPTKLTRTYKVGQRYDRQAGAMKALPYEGKAITIEKKGPHSFDFTSAGKKLGPDEVGDMATEFYRPNTGKREDLLPKAPVKVGESWTLDPVAASKGLGGELPLPINAAKSKATAKLTRAYTKDGKQWGVITFDLDLSVDSEPPPGQGKGGESLKGTIKVTGPLETVIDGSARDSEMTLTIKLDVLAKMDKEETKMTGGMAVKSTVKTVK